MQKPTFPNEYVDVSGFPVHISTMATLNAWRPHYWTQLPLEVRQKIDLDTLEYFGIALLAHKEVPNLEWTDSYRQLQIHRCAVQTHRFYWTSCRDALAARHKAIIDFMRVPCGARKKNGQQCKAFAEPGRNRCRFHGGKSSGPRTIDGKIKSLSKLTQYRRRPDLLIAKRRELEKEMRKETGLRELSMRPELLD